MPQEVEYELLLYAGDTLLNISISKILPKLKRN